MRAIRACSVIWTLALMLLVTGLASVVGAGLAYAQGEDSCCCDSMKRTPVERAEAEAHAAHAKASSDTGCSNGCRGDICQCQINNPTERMPGEPAVVLSSATVSFGPPVAAQTNFQLRLPEPRAPGKLTAHGAVELSPPSSPLYLTNSILLL